MEKIYRGNWADRLESGMELPVGGSIFNDQLSIKIELDFEGFNGELENYRSPEKVSEHYERNKQAVAEWLSQAGSKADPYLFFVTNVVQNKVQNLLNVRAESPASDLERRARFKDDCAKLTELKGVAMCAEQASLGQYLLQNVLREGYTSAYMGGVEAETPNGSLGDHSFIIMKDLNSKTYIFDIARPRRGNLPRVLETDVPFNPELFKGKDNLLVGATEILQGGRLFFGVGHPMLERENVVINKV